MIPYGKQDIAAEEIDAVVEILKAERLTQGPVISQFEEAVAAYCGARHAIAVSNGTAALHVAAMAIDIKSGDEGITSPNTFLASANCLLFCRAIPRFADIDPVTNCIDPDKIKKSITPPNTCYYPNRFCRTPLRNGDNMGACFRE